MDVALLEMDPAQPSGTGVRGRAIREFLEARGHAVDVLGPTPGLFPRLMRRAHLGGLAAAYRPGSGNIWSIVADDIEPRLRARRYDLVLARGPEVGYVLTRPLAAVKILDMANIGFLELYSTWRPDFGVVDAVARMEREIFTAVDHILSPHECLSELFASDLGPDLAKKLVVARLGCEPAARVAAWSDPPRLVYAGSVYPLQDPFLLSLLAGRSPYPLVCHGPRDPNSACMPHRLDYRGYGDTPAFLADYQIGLITVSRDRLRIHSPSTKFAYYFAHGLPTLFPAWMREGHEYPACALPYDEENFPGQVRRIGDRSTWETMAVAARATAEHLRWGHVLLPLAEILRMVARR